MKNSAVGVENAELRGAPPAPLGAETLTQDWLRLSQLATEHGQSLNLWVRRDGAITYANQAMCDRLGYPREELLGMKISALAPKFPAGKWTREGWPDWSDRQGQKVFELEFCCRDGTSFPAEIRTTSVHVDSEEFALGVVTDLTNRRETERRLIESEKRYRAVAETQSEFVVRWKPDGIRTFVNDAYCRFFGQSREEMIGTSFYPLVSEEYRKQVRDRIAALRPETPTTTGIHRVQLANGSSAWQEWTDTALFDPEGTLLGYQSVGRDVTDRVRAEADLRESEARFRELVENAPVCIHQLDLAGRLTTMNPAGLRMMETKDESAICGLDYLDAVAEHDCLRVGELLKKAIAGERSHFEFTTPEALGARVFRSCFVPLWGRKGEVVRLMGITEDITDQKKAESDLQAAAAEIGRLKEQLEAENVYLREEIRMAHLHGGIVGSSPPLKRVLIEAEKVAVTDTSVLILGETGTGKELLARAIHAMSPRNGQPLVIVNCGAMPVNLVESQLFGCERGAYTGAVSKQLGRFEVANGGTIFLDEIGELPLEAQAKLLRVLQEGEIERLGSVRPIPVDVRVVAATNRDLEEMVASKEFRVDLYYRLNVFPLTLPPLRERGEDIPAIAWKFVEEFSAKLGLRIEKIARSSLEALQRYPWPGNIRELRNTIERAMIGASGNQLRVELPQGRLSRSANGDPPFKSLAQAERDHICAALLKTGWKVRGKGGAAEILELPPSTLESRMKKLGIKRVGA